MQPHRSTHPEVMRQRNAEYARTKTAPDVQKLMQRWDAEDAETPAREQLLLDRVAQLERELHVLQAKVAATPRAVGKSLARLRRELSAHLGARIDAVEARPAGLRYCGVWSADQTYDADSLVTLGGSGWIATNAMGPGVRPGTAESAWRLAIKSDISQLGKLVRAEVQKQLGSKPPGKEKG